MYHEYVLLISLIFLSLHPCADFHNKHYSMGSPFYSAPDDIEMTERLVEQDQVPPTPSLNMDHTPLRSPLLMGEDD